MAPIHHHESTQTRDTRLLHLHLIALASLAPAVAVATFAEQFARGAWDPTVALGVLSGAALWGLVLFEGSS